MNRHITNTKYFVTRSFEYQIRQSHRHQQHASTHYLCVACNFIFLRSYHYKKKIVTTTSEANTQWQLSTLKIPWLLNKIHDATKQSSNLQLSRKFLKICLVYYKLCGVFPSFTMHTISSCLWLDSNQQTCNVLNNGRNLLVRKYQLLNKQPLICQRWETLLIPLSQSTWINTNKRMAFGVSLGFEERGSKHKSWSNSDQTTFNWHQ